MNNFKVVSYGLTGGGGHLENKICSFFGIKHKENCKLGKEGKTQGIFTHEVECGYPECVDLWSVRYNRC